MSSNHIDRDSSDGMKWLLLVSSLIVVVLLVLVAGSIVRTEWRSHQNNYRKLLLAKAKDNTSRQSAKAFKVQLQQVVVPELGVADRCVSCHTGIEDPRMTGEKQPYRTHPGSILRDHPVSKYGCTICHRGQGRATTSEDAKGVHSFWDYPMLPNHLSQAPCGQCHDPLALKGRGGDTLAAGAELFKSKGCMSCHKLDGRGGTLGIALDDEGRRVIHQFVLANLKSEHTVWNWLEEHFRDPSGVVAGSQMRNPTLTESEIRALTTYVLSLTKATLPNEYIASDKHVQKYAAIRPGKPDGAGLYKQYCFSCHESGAYGRWDKTFKRFMPAIRGRGLATSPAGFITSSIELGREGTQMPGWQACGLTASEIKALEIYLRAGQKPVAAPVDSVKRGDVKNGQKLYAQLCQGCHGAGGKGGIAPVLASASFRNAASDAFVMSTIRNGRTDTAMPAFQRSGRHGLSNADLADLLAAVRAMK